jgi:hypothetical protein
MAICREDEVNDEIELVREKTYCGSAIVAVKCGFGYMTRPWIAQGEKYALIGLSIKTAGNVEVNLRHLGIQILTNLAFKVPDHWSAWLGSMRVEEIEMCNLFIVATSDTSPAGVLDGENQRLERIVWNFYLGLLLTCAVRPTHKPVRLTGSYENNLIDVQQQGDEDAPIGSIITGYPALGSDEIATAASLATGLTQLTDPQRTGWCWHLLRTLTVYVGACTTPDMMDRIHQYARCVEGLILPSKGNTESQFKSRTELFIGPYHHNLMGEIYRVRSAVEHLHEIDYMHPFDRDKRLALVRQEAIIADIARQALRRVLRR